ncbi:MAG: RNA methyltransferase [Alphaproteobacteria bacterium]|nr:RNA methyltransferase [Alphaproteobacteria bacterium]
MSDRPDAAPDLPASPFINDDRVERWREALARRLSSVAVITEAVHRRHNTSAILRSCECFGVHQVHLVTGPFRPSKGAARGAERWLDVHMHPTLPPAIDALRAQGFRIYVADLAADAWSPDTLPVEGKVAILFGSELSGVSDEARALADGAVCVPMRGLTESLNVSVAAACVLQRVTERKRQTLPGPGDLDAAVQTAWLDGWIDREDHARAGRRARLGLGEE